MKRKSKLGAIIFLLIALIAITGYLVIGNPLVLINNQKLANSINSINSDVVQLSENAKFKVTIADEIITLSYQK